MFNNQVFHFILSMFGFFKSEKKAHKVHSKVKLRVIKMGIEARFQMPKSPGKRDSIKLRTGFVVLFFPKPNGCIFIEELLSLIFSFTVTKRKLNPSPWIRAANIRLCVVIA